MNSKEYNELISGIIKPIGDEFCSEYNDIFWRDGWEKLVSTEYERNRKVIKSMMRHTVTGNADGRIDRHKVGTALLLAILKTSPLATKIDYLSTKEGAEIAQYFRNEILAFKSAQQLITQFSLKEALDDNNQVHVDYLSKDFDYPVSTDNEDYEQQLYKALYYTKNESTFNMLIMSNLFFVLEQYNILFKRHHN